MQIMIDIPKDDYYDILQYAELKANTEFENLMIVAIKNGTPLPKGHGRLIDADAIDTSWSDNEVIETLQDAPTVIEADKESDDNEV